MVDLTALVRMKKEMVPDAPIVANLCIIRSGI